MAYEPYPDSGYETQDWYEGQAKPEPRSLFSGLKRFTNFMASVVSLALLVAVGYWGYNLVMRDVSGIPVVRAVEGDMRVRPDTPGGELAQHQGLAVNAVVADGEAAPTADRIVLAPQPVELTEEDLPMDKEAVAIVQQAIADNRLITGEAAEKALAQADDTEDNQAEIIAASIKVEEAAIDEPKGLQTSLRPVARPKGFRATDDVAAAVAAAVAETSKEIAPAKLAPGTRLAQLGAFDSADQARAAWDTAQGRFGDLMSGKSRVVQQASSGGQEFYRLRAHGFTDLGDANRFCAAIVAEGSDCIPVVSR